MSFFDGVTNYFRKPTQPASPPPAAPAPTPAPAQAPQKENTGFFGSMKAMGSTLMSVARSNPITAPLANAFSAKTDAGPAPSPDGAKSTGTSPTDQSGGNPFANGQKPTVGPTQAPTQQLPLVMQPKEVPT